MGALLVTHELHHRLHHPPEKDTSCILIRLSSYVKSNFSAKGGRAPVASPLHLRPTITFCPRHLARGVCSCWMCMCGFTSSPLAPPSPYVRVWLHHSTALASPSPSVRVWLHHSARPMHHHRKNEKARSLCLLRTAHAGTLSITFCACVASPLHRSPHRHMRVVVMRALCALFLCRSPPTRPSVACSCAAEFVCMVPHLLLLDHHRVVCP
jgi:hypothetical protein